MRVGNAKPTPSATAAAAPNATPTMRSLRSGLADARKPPSTMPQALHTMYTLRHMAATATGTPCNWRDASGANAWITLMTMA